MGLFSYAVPTSGGEAAERRTGRIGWRTSHKCPCGRRLWVGNGQIACPSNSNVLATHFKMVACGA